MTQVFKFGGASVKDAAGVRNLAHIIQINQHKKILIVVSAMGKTTNALERLWQSYIHAHGDVYEIFEEIKSAHYQIIEELFPDPKHPVYDEIANTFVEIDWILEDEPHPDPDFNYDQIVSMGEILSTRIIAAYLNECKLNAHWLDARSYIQTDNTYREAQVNWSKTKEAIQQFLPSILQKQMVVTQGFIGCTSENFTTTLGREGSDYTAAIFANCLGAENVTIWKDVPGVLNADPKLFPDTQKYEQLPYAEALEMTYYGATIIHPKTIKPLQNAGIPLLVKPFGAPTESGTTISEQAVNGDILPAVIVKKNQVLVSISTKDFSFITEDHLSEIFAAFAGCHIKMNTMQVSALSFSVCIDDETRKFEKFKLQMQADFKIKYNENLELITIRHYTKEMLAHFSTDRKVFMEQLSRNTAQLVLK
ncbi:MAG: aspartate kinase [Sphingobacteriaceae bacterium]